MKQTQLLKGILEGCVLSILKDETTYGYELVQKLIQFGFADLSAGTVYPLLQKLEKQHMISGELRASPDGPNRKYYSLTEEGIDRLEEFDDQWEKLSDIVNVILKRG
ncbi:PadR family transcriptional regulator [Vagococcus sp. CY52-2]|uniref:PadR family transcriptional regulator n=1 Tax=Vagococcus sp. CY52-2 TaxID=2925838 RepID=UPI001F579B88|nr:PadR family transcriptional regulator [Vagococcus sp. CY52-2]UNM89028.1 PadR family transcriptional regulator [Vagococcus sp. CY52-2]